MTPERVTPAQRRAVRARAGGRCEYCHTPDGFVPGSFAIEHILPQAGQGVAQDYDSRRNAGQEIPCVTPGVAHEEWSGSHERSHRTCFLTLREEILCFCLILRYA